jgi:hypothetical protein
LMKSSTSVGCTLRYRRYTLQRNAVSQPKRMGSWQAALSARVLTGCRSRGRRTRARTPCTRATPTACAVRTKSQPSQSNAL